MDRFAELEAFVNVVDNGGFTEAARKMGVSKSAISKSVSALEARLAVRLLNRTTRRVSPTEVGLAYYDRAIDVLKDVNDADSLVTSMQASPRGSLKVSAPVNFGIGHLSSAAARFLTRYEDVDINMVLDDRFVELVAEGFDVAIRIGTLDDSSLKARKLAETRMTLVASEGYLKRFGTPKTLEDLSSHNLLHYSHLSSSNYWKLKSQSGEVRQVRVGGRLTVNNGASLKMAAIAGLGIAHIPTFIVGCSVEQGDLVRLLPDLRFDPMGVHAVYPSGRFMQPKLRAFIDFLVEHFRTVDTDNWPIGAT